MSPSTTSTVYDTETGKYPLILQGSKIVGEGQGAQLLYGNERLRTVSLTLSRRQDKTPIDLGSAPVTDQAGVNGLSQPRGSALLAPVRGCLYWWRVTRRACKRCKPSIAGASGAEQIVVGVGQTGNQAVTRADVARLRYASDHRGGCGATLPCDTHQALNTHGRTLTTLTKPRVNWKR